MFGIVCFFGIFCILPPGPNVPDGRGGFVPFYNSRVLPDGSLRPYDPYLDGLPPGYPAPLRSPSYYSSNPPAPAPYYPPAPEPNAPLTQEDLDRAYRERAQRQREMRRERGMDRPVERIPEPYQPAQPRSPPRPNPGLRLPGEEGRSASPPGDPNFHRYAPHDWRYNTDEDHQPYD